MSFRFSFLDLSGSFHIDGSSNIPILDGSNFSDWKEIVLFTLGYMDLDLALRIDEPPALTEQSTADQKAASEKWERSNRLSLLLLQSQVAKNIRGVIPHCKTVKEFLGAIEAQFVTSNKARVSTLMSKLVSMKYSGDSHIRQHILEMRNIVTQLNDMKFAISDSFWSI